MGNCLILLLLSSCLYSLAIESVNKAIHRTGKGCTLVLINDLVMKLSCFCRIYAVWQFFFFLSKVFCKTQEVFLYLDRGDYSSFHHRSCSDNRGNAITTEEGGKVRRNEEKDGREERGFEHVSRSLVWVGVVLLQATS